jgi:peptidyl-prolyl cis-trans isomerase A (cyclophilin A)
MKVILSLACGFAGFLALAGCDKTKEPMSIGSAPAALPPAVTPATSTAPPPPSGPSPSSSSLASAVHPELLDPSKLTAKAPAVFQARFTTGKGDFVIEVQRDWAPNAADRFYNLVKAGFYDDTRFFRVMDGFMAQFGISGDPAVAAKWQNADIPDDPVTQSNKPGFVTFAQTSAPNSRSTQIFINYGDNSRLDATRFAPFGQVISGMDVVNGIYKEYGQSPDQGAIQAQGNAYLDAKFPKLDRVKHAQIMGKGMGGPDAGGK